MQKNNNFINNDENAFYIDRNYLENNNNYSEISSNMPHENYYDDGYYNINNIIIVVHIIVLEGTNDVNHDRMQDFLASEFQHLMVIGF